MKIVKGDLIRLAEEGEFDVIVQGCNCFHTFGSGLAAQIKVKFPMAYNADRMTSYGDKEKLGQVSMAFVKSHKKAHYFMIINGYTQFSMGAGLHVDYAALRQVFRTVKKTFAAQRIGYPMIGAGLAGGDWKIISKIINEELKGEDHTFVIYDPN